MSDVVRSIRTVLGCDVLVVDDGSSDRTAAIAQAAGAYVIQHPFNLGVGAALRTGFRFAADQGAGIVIQVDGDGQHDPEDANRLIDRLRHESLDLVIGSRFGSGYKVGRVRRTIMRMLSWEVSRRLGVRVTDTTSGFRAFGKRAVEQFARAYPSAYLSDTVEALLLAADWDFRVAEVPVTMHPRAGGKASAGSVKSALHLARLALVILLHRVRQPISPRGSVESVEV